jgi:hypothetical protein
VEYELTKQRLPRGHGYPLPRSLLDSALEEAGIESVAWVHYSLGHGSIHSDYRHPFRAWAPGAGGIAAHRYGLEPPRNRQFLAGEPGTVSLSVCSVPSPERPLARMLLVDHGLPRLIHWLQEVEGRSQTWRDCHHWWGVFFRDGWLREAEDDVEIAAYRPLRIAPEGSDDRPL